MRILSLGWGVQSFTLAAMAALGELNIHYAVHADTTWEREATYTFAEHWTPWLKERGVEVRTVKSSRTAAVTQLNKTSVFIPAFTLDDRGNQGQLRRQCTKTWKIDPVRRFISAIMRANGQKLSPGAVTLLMGISLDEFHRMRTSDVKYITHEYPLIERRMTRQDCLLWLERHNLPSPGKSACVFCPYHNGEAWKAMARVGGKDWGTAIAVDEQIRTKRPPFPLFVHASRKPLSEAVKDDGQLAMFQDTACEGGFCHA